MSDATIPVSAPSNLTRRQALRVLTGGFSVLAVLSACQAPVTPISTPTASNPLIKPKPAGGVDLTPLLASSELALGRNRVALGLIDAQNQAITSGQVHLDFFKVTGQSAEKRSEADATFRAVELQNKGVWVAPANFDAVGPWGAQVSLTRPGESSRVARLSFQVIEHFSAPGYGAPALRSASPTLRDVGGDATHLCTHQPPCELHDRTIKEALQPGQKPLLLIFATPAFCTSAICAPELDAVLRLRGSGYADRVSFLHVEIYAYPFEQQKPAQTVQEWNLQSEPWVFIVDRGGIVRDRFEGSAPLEELEPALKAVL